MSSEIIQSVTYDNYNDFQYANFIFSQFSFHYFEGCLVMKLTLGKKVAKMNKVNHFKLVDLALGLTIHNATSVKTMILL
jgi:hypothetical protein